MRTRIESMMVPILDPETGEIIGEERQNVVFPVDNAWILARQSKQIVLSIPQLQYTVGQSASLTAQLTTPELVDYSVQNLAENLSIQLQIGDVIQTVNLVNGQWSDTVNFSYAGVYLVKCLSLPSNEITITVV